MAANKCLAIKKVSGESELSQRKQHVHIVFSSVFFAIQNEHAASYIISSRLLGEFQYFHVVQAFDQNLPTLPCLILAIWIKRFS